MTDTVLPNKNLTEPTVGADANLWGGILNTDLVNIDAAFGGTSTLTSAAGTTVLTSAQYIPQNIVITSATAAVTYQVPSGTGGFWSIWNNTSYNATWATNASGTPTTVVIPPGARVRVVSDGTNVYFAEGDFVGGGTRPAVISYGGGYTPSVPVTFNATMTINCFLSNVFEATLTSNVTSLTLSNPSDGQTINWVITQGSGGQTITWPSGTGSGSFKWPGGAVGALSTTSGAVDILVATYIAATGFWYATLLKGFA